MQSAFMTMLFRMKYINRWSLMFNTQTESLSQHTVEAAFLVHFLATIGNTYFKKDYDAEKLAVYALFHDAGEIFTGDLPTPIKYYSEEMRENYKAIEKTAAQKLLDYLPTELKAVYSVFFDDGLITVEEKTLLKIADRLCAYIKCIQENNAGNKEFLPAYKSIGSELCAIKNDELAYFMENCLPSFSLTLDELKFTL